MIQVFKIASIALGAITVTGFTGFAIYWLWLSITDNQIARRGGFLFVLAPVALAIASFFIFRAMTRWANRQG